MNYILNLKKHLSNRQWIVLHKVIPMILKNFKISKSLNSLKRNKNVLNEFVDYICTCPPILQKIWLLHICFVVAQSDKSFTENLSDHSMLAVLFAFFLTWYNSALFALQNLIYLHTVARWSQNWMKCIRMDGLLILFICLIQLRFLRDQLGSIHACHLAGKLNTLPIVKVFWYRSFDFFAFFLESFTVTKMFMDSFEIQTFLPLSPPMYVTNESFVSSNAIYLFIYWFILNWHILKKIWK